MWLITDNNLLQEQETGSLHVAFTHTFLLLGMGSSEVKSLGGNSGTLLKPSFSSLPQRQ